MVISTMTLNPGLLTLNIQNSVHDINCHLSGNHGSKICNISIVSLQFHFCGIHKPVLQMNDFVFCIFIKFKFIPLITIFSYLNNGM